MNKTGFGIMEPKLCVLFGPSGVGKSTLVKRLLSDFPDQFEFSVSHTTRTPRAGETHGKDYYFVNKAQFEAMITNNEMLEYAMYNHNYYGTSIQAIETIGRRQKRCLLDIDMQGVKLLQARASPLPAVYISIHPPSMAHLESRLRLRNTETEESLAGRLLQAKSELAFATAPGVSDFSLTNHDLDACYAELKQILHVS